MTTTAMTAVQEAKAIIDHIDLTTVQEALIQQGWSIEGAIATCQGYRRYLLLRWYYPDQLLPASPDILAAWREHVLQNNAYLNICQTLFGHYVDYDSPEGQSAVIQSRYQQAFEGVTQALCQKVLGVTLPSRPHFSRLHRFSITLIELLKQWGFVFLLGLLSVLGPALYKQQLAREQLVYTQQQQLYNTIQQTLGNAEDLYRFCQMNPPTVWQPIARSAEYQKSSLLLKRSLFDNIVAIIDQTQRLYQENLIVKSDVLKIAAFTRLINNLSKSPLSQVCAHFSASLLKQAKKKGETASSF